MARSLPALGLAATLSIALVGCASTGPADAAAAPTPTPAAPGASAEPSAAAPTEPAPSEPEGVDRSDWLEYATHDGDLTYRYPADWTLESESTFFSPDADRDDVEDPYERWMDASTLIAPNGQQLLHSYDFVDLGGACGDPVNFQPIEILSDEPHPAIADTSIVTAALRSVDGRWMFGVGLVGGDVSAIDTCVFRFTAGSSDGGLFLGTLPDLISTAEDPLWTVDTLDDATAYMETGEYATIVEILRSARLA
ncbi:MULTISPECIES: hypothetical protein [unclassified Agrococcus]|uniref:hypothetical protein n=1 Tax=unclassified Agrococcus TaxID=2615065 RepID=UPI00361A2B0B